MLSVAVRLEMAGAVVDCGTLTLLPPYPAKCRQVPPSRRHVLVVASPASG